MVKIKGKVVIVLIFTLCLFWACWASNPVMATGTKIDVLDEEDSVPATYYMGETVDSSGYIELWHYSGGYWGGGISYKIWDSELGGDLKDEDALAEAIHDRVEVAFNLPPAMYTKLTNEDSLKIRVLSELKDDKGDTVPLSKMFDIDKNDKLDTANPNKYKRITARLDGGQLIISGRMKPHFSDESFAENVSGSFNKEIPIVDPIYGYNVYAIWSRSGSDWGGMAGYYDGINPLALPDPSVNRLSLGHIANSRGHLKAGYDFSTTKKGTFKSGDASVGYGTLMNGGAVGIHFNYPLRVEIYSGNYPNDLVVKEEMVVSSAAVGKEVAIALKVQSTFDKKVDKTAYEWSIKDGSGNDIGGVVYDGDTGLAMGDTAFEAEEEKTVIAKFIMPDTEVAITYTINKDGLEPVESFLANNKYEGTITPVYPTTSVGGFELDYDVYSKDIEFEIGSSTASLTLPRGSWKGNATGALSVTDASGGYYSSFNVINNPPVNEPSSSVTRTPWAQVTLDRDTLTDGQDNPISGTYLNLSSGDTLDQEAEITFEGSISRSFVYYYDDDCADETLDPDDHCPGHKDSGSVSADFAPGKHEADLGVKVYNGRRTITPQVFRDEVENNTINDKLKNLFWTSEAFDLAVKRWMYRVDDAGNKVDGMKADGQYQREFTHQCDGNIEWTITPNKSLEASYYKSRQAAKNNKYDKGLYDKAVFVSDKYADSIDYPIRSGYYFNPTGSYTFTVSTNVYKDINTGMMTEDHEEMLEKVLSSFRYESDMVYIDNSKNAVDLQGNSVRTSNGHLVKQNAVLSIGDPVGINGYNLLNVIDHNTDSGRYVRNVETLYHSESTTGYTDSRLKEALEGYSESGTSSSHYSYKYREYVADREKMYKISESTTITVEVNPSNRKVYTHAKMEDGTYGIRVYVADMDLATTQGDHAYEGLGLIKGISYLDYMEIEVKGSMYDDVNN